MPVVELIMPKMGESVIEATVINWLKKEGDSVEEDETVLEVATDKVDTEVPSPYSGIITKILHQVNDVVPVGGALALIETQANDQIETASSLRYEQAVQDAQIEENLNVVEATPAVEAQVQESAIFDEPKKITESGPAEELKMAGEARYYSPLVRNIARAENISKEELERIPGSGGNNRVTKDDMMAYLKTRKQGPIESKKPGVIGSKDSSRGSEHPEPVVTSRFSTTQPSGLSKDPNVEIVEMDRMRRIIAEHMIHSQQTSAHVTSFVEADVTHMVRWKSEYTGEFYNKYGTRLTYTPLFIECVNKAIHDFPRINSSVVGNDLHIKKNIHIGIATALEDGNLIVPVIKDAHDLSLIGLAKKVNDLAERARKGSLSPEEIRGGTFTISNIGTFGNLMGTPIINQPQVSVLALGAIKKKPVVLETQGSDTIAIRHMMFLSLSYDHRIIDGFYGGSFLNRIAEYIEAFDPNRKI